MAKRGGMGANHSARVGSDDWITPRHVLAGLGRPFDLDPCASLTQPWAAATRAYTRLDDGLKKPWEGEVWLNPPYSNAGPWMARLAVAHNDGVSLLFARTETDMWHEHVWARASGILFLRGRLSFHLPDGSLLANSGAPSVLIAYGARSLRRLTNREPGALPGAMVIL